MSIRSSAVSLALLTVTNLGFGVAESDGQPARPVLRVMLQNEANVPSDLVAMAQAEVTRLFDDIEVSIAWVVEVPTSGEPLRVVSLTNWEPSAHIDASVLGYTQVAPGKRGVRAYVFWRRVEDASRKFTAGVDRILAIAVAHELGHMLLPDGKHAKTGLMQAPWDANHFRSAAPGLLLFSLETAQMIRRELADRMTARGTKP